MGRTEEANLSLAALRDRYRYAPVAGVSVRLNLAEGLAGFFAGDSGLAVDKVRRAHALAKATNLRAERALCAAWLAHLEFGLLAVPGMAAHLEESLEYSDTADHETRARTCLVTAVAMHFANRYDMAKPWYSRARVHAAEEGDDATLSALLNNMTGMGVMNLRQSILTGSDGAKLALDALMGASSTASYDSMKGMKGLNTWVPLLRAYVASLVGDVELALTMYREHVDEAVHQGQERMMPYIRADMAWCYARIGEGDLATANATTAEQSLSVDVQVDDRAATHSRLTATYELLGQAECAASQERRASQAWGEYELLQHETVRALGRVATMLPSAES